MNIPDLLENEPRVELDSEILRETLSFAFSTGKSQLLMEDILGDSHIGKHNYWNPANFAADLFLDEFVEHCFTLPWFSKTRPMNMRYLKKLISHPPTELATIQFRQQILRELVSKPEMVEQIKELYVALRKLAWAFDTSSFGVQLDLTEFRMDIMHQVYSVIELMSTSFVNASSGLSRVPAYAREIKESEAFAELSDIIDYEEHLSKVDLQIRIGATGDLRGFHVLKIEENEENQFYSNPLQRFAEKLKLWLRGYRFHDSDLVSILVERVFGRLEDKLIPFIQMLGQVEFYLVSLGFREQAAGYGLPVCLPDFTRNEAPAGAAPQYQELYNPLLFAAEIRPVPGDLTFHRNDALTLVTGPNSGGKTRLLQALGLAQLMGQSGMFAPAAAARLRLVTGLYASLREVTEIDQEEGRLGQELKRIHNTFEQCPHGAMVLLDELCSGTNPSEGAEIVSLVLEMLAQLEPFTVITTHFLDYVRQLEHKPHLAQLNFLKVALGEQEQPTYRFVPGVAKSSLARRIAARLGVTREELQQLTQQKRTATQPRLRAIA